MKPTYLIALLLLFSCQSNSTGSTAGKAGSSNNVSAASEVNLNSLHATQKLHTVADIKAAYTKMHAALTTGKLDSTGFRYNCYNEKSGTVVYYADPGGLSIIKHAHSEYSHFSAESEYYIQNDSVYFIFSKETAWGFYGEAKGDVQTQDNITEKRVYLIDGQPIRCLEKKYTILSNASAPPQPSNIPNHEVACASMQDVVAMFQVLLKHQAARDTINCLEAD